MGRGWINTIVAANNAKKGARFTKLAREIQVAAKLGGPDPNNNSRLRMAIDAAREEACPKDTIERAIKKGAGLLDGGEIEEVNYEGYGPHRVAVIVECQTDNRNRTASEIRNLFNKHDGELSSVGWMFDRVASVEGTHTSASIDAEAEAIEANANDVRALRDGVYRFTGAPEDLKAIESVLRDRGWTIKTAELTYQAKTPMELTAEQKKDVIAFLQLLDDNDDTSRLHVNVDFE